MCTYVVRHSYTCRLKGLTSKPFRDKVGNVTPFQPRFYMIYPVTTNSFDFIFHSLDKDYN